MQEWHNIRDEEEELKDKPKNLKTYNKEYIYIEDIKHILQTLNYK